MRLRDILLAVTAPVNWALGFTFSKAALGAFAPILPMALRLERIQNEWNRSEFASARPRAVAYATRACVTIERCLPLPGKGKLKML